MTDYAATADLQTYLGGLTFSGDESTVAGLAITASSSAIDRSTNRTFGPAAATVASTTLYGPWSAGAASIAILSATGFAVGQDIQIDVNTYTTTLAEVRHVVNLVGTTITLDLPLSLSHQATVAVKTVLPRYFTRYKDRHEPRLPFDYSPLPLDLIQRRTPKVMIDDLFDTSSVVVQDRISGVPIGLDRYGPYNAVSLGRPYTSIEFVSSTTLPRGEGNVLVAANFGWTSIPATIKNACLLQSARYMKRKDAPFGIAGATGQGNDMRLLAQLDPDVAMMVGDFRRYWSAV